MYECMIATLSPTPSHVLSVPHHRLSWHARMKVDTFDTSSFGEIVTKMSRPSASKSHSDRANLGT